MDHVPSPVITLFPDQQEALEKVLEMIRLDSTGQALVVAPTAWGKTVFFSFLVAWWLQEKGSPVLIIAHRDELLEQARMKLQRISPDCAVGKVGGGVHEYGDPVTVASIDTIHQTRHLKKLKHFGFGLIICDECHHAPAPKYQKVFQELNKAFHLGVTATPNRFDQRSLEPIFGPPVFSMTIVDAITSGRLSDLKAVAIRTETSLEAVRLAKSTEGEKDFQVQDLERAIDTPARNVRVVEAYQEHAPGKRAVCFGVTVAHAQHLAEVFLTKGVAAATITGQTPREERRRLYQKFHEGGLTVLTTVMVLTEGFDEPLIECVIMARPTLSPVVFLQSLGRGLRVAEGKTQCLLLDLTDNCIKQKQHLLPQTIEGALGITLQDHETVLQCVKRQKQAEQEKIAPVRTLSEERHIDEAVNLFSSRPWEKCHNNSYCLQVGAQKHRILLTPSRKPEETYDVWAFLSPTYEGQLWLQAAPLAWAQQHAEMKARLLEKDERNLVLVDIQAPWRSTPASEKQISLLKKHRVAVRPGITRGEASDLIDQIVAKKAQKAQKGSKVGT
ncbi:DEAD/DEAH box helicase [Tengunoibacter tsumagoiensis]|uniref:DEAD/DEAH box helicase n=1 Tax=Tengunoibacter tsumagoiensis TaxID=2014871 RepID=A0A402A813_9CHLR|nr:DEAD/DEAH box helicase [Tengunoibacter tsumagoiensis]GCE15307.1 hypothetical protein KTT_51660 [Tengunoibacter tsumagoiensis]